MGDHENDALSNMSLKRMFNEVYEARVGSTLHGTHDLIIKLYNFPCQGWLLMYRQ